jgi:enhancing lycopene biosynthesis protein 2
MAEVRTKIPRRIGVILSAESIWEVVYTFYQIDLNGFMRLPIHYDHVVPESKPNAFRMAYYESVSKLEISKTEDVKPGSLQALIVSTGENEFNHLSNFEQVGEAFGVDQGFRAFLRAAYRRGMPIGAFGYAVPLLVKSIHGITKTGPVVTVGNNPILQTSIEAAGAQAVVTRPTEVIIDETNNLVTTGGMIATNRPTEVAQDCENMFKAIMELIKG